MKIHLCVVGKLRNGPEKELIDDYLHRFEKIGRAHGLGPVLVNEVEDKKNGGMLNEAILLQRVIPKGAKVIILDERGEVISSPNFAKKISSYANNSISDLAIIIGVQMGSIQNYANKQTIKYHSEKWFGHTR